MRTGFTQNKRTLQRCFAAVMVCLCVALSTGCVNSRPVIDADTTPQPTRAQMRRTPEPTLLPIASPEPTNEAGEAYDAKGVLITGAEHYARYLTFKNIMVYEEGGDTFLDGMVQNSYLSPITCAVDVVYRDESGEEIARSRLQTRDGSYLLVLGPGETPVLARILTDMTLTDRDFTLEFETEVGIRPLNRNTGED